MNTNQSYQPILIANQSGILIMKPIILYSLTNTNQSGQPIMIANQSGISIQKPIIWYSLVFLNEYQSIWLTHLGCQSIRHSHLEANNSVFLNEFSTIK
jgi:uncharacterized protein with PQ loop repeat